ncbi:MAG: amidohydrolase [Solobacterium sp.]|nr:amidohydrolase [Solobacterium sp.]MBR3343527.1 amidohydrolase [Solobacterium sp.]HAE15474.1 amidohydrolase [Erysipelotrichaceae bacterium]
MTLIKNGRIHDMVNREPYIADILIENGKIKAIGMELSGDGDVFDAAGLDVYPGFIDAHSHIGVSGTGIGFEGTDYNEMNDICSPEVRGIDSFNPFDASIPTAAKAGITTVAAGPGSANVLGGTWIAVKLHGVCVDDMIVKDPVAMKCAFGENPKRCYQKKNASSRMSVAARFRECMYQAREYMLKKEAAGDDITKRPPFNLKYESLIPVFKKEIPLKAHAHQANDILTAIRLAKEFDVDLTLEHVTEGHLIADKLAENKQYMMAVGPTFTHASKYELQYKSWETPGVLAAKGCHVSIVTDHPFALEEYLPIYAGLAVKAGMDPYEALKAITINPAEHLLIADRVGSLEAGKDADIVVYEGSPFEVTSEVRLVLIDGVRI